MTEAAEPLRLLTVEEAAKRLSIARSHAYLLLQRGVLRSVRIGRCRRIATRDLEDFIDHVREEPAPPPPATSWR